MPEEILEEKNEGDSENEVKRTSFTENENELTPSEVLRRALKEAWKHPIMKETKRNLRYIGKTIVKPAYKKIAKEKHIGEYYSEVYTRRYKEIEKLEARLNELKEQLEALKRL